MVSPVTVVVLVRVVVLRPTPFATLWCWLRRPSDCRGRKMFTLASQLTTVAYYACVTEGVSAVLTARIGVR